ncbi:MAG TPA: hypothetical protein ENG06_02015 [Thermoplasmatales archaeon]|nr:MAG: hypothetical protein FE046_03625 [Thermoplasmata archaeon]RLF32522.1 MAG: hypothetical protein DRN07_04830 [Thermoplasmata archaeon]HDN50533.1 hypothetical protein [Thermoplasmatales archaeon]
MPFKHKLSYVAKFVVSPDGKRIGESISVFEDLLIIKKKETFYAIPFKHVELKNNEIHLKGIVQWDRAKSLARKWKHAQDGYRGQ